MRKLPFLLFPPLCWLLWTTSPSTGGPQEPPKETPSKEWPVITPEAFARGAKLFRKKTCNGCHAFGDFFGKCPDLKGVTQRHESQWLRRWLKDPDEMRKNDPVAAVLSEQYAEVMPFLDLEDGEIEDLIVYLLREGRPPDPPDKS